MGEWGISPLLHPLPIKGKPAEALDITIQNLANSWIVVGIIGRRNKCDLLAGIGCDSHDLSYGIQNCDMVSTTFKRVHIFYHDFLWILKTPT
jgi:hypothetical protein